MNKQLIVGIIVLTVVGIGIFVWQGGNKTEDVVEKTTTTPNVTTSTDGTNSKTILTPEEDVQSYTLEDVALHSKAEDCWMAIEGNVYDMTPYIQKQIHPGGAAILLGCGKDSTNIFNLRPQDNKPHSQNARDMLKDYYLGALAK